MRTVERNLNGMSVAVTGGARGIGAAIAAELARAGARAAVGDLDAEAARQTAASLEGDAASLALDVTSTESFAGFLDAAEAAHGPLDVLVNNAGIMWVGPFAEEDEATAHRQFEVNLHGTMRGMKLALPGMLARGHGHLVNIASMASRVTPAGEATYTATKHAVYGYSAAVRAELRGSGVEVSLVMPAVVETELARGTSHGRTRRLEPGDVARAVAAGVRRPRFEVYVPGSLSLLSRVYAAAPLRMRDAMARALVPDQARLTDRSARADYERGLRG
jgi:short-subunit dehydrogenase